MCLVLLAVQVVLSRSLRFDNADKTDLQKWLSNDMNPIDRFGFARSGFESELQVNRAAFATNGFEQVRSRGGKVLEIAPLASPLFPTDYQGYRSVDVESYEGLLQKYAKDANVNKSALVKPDYVWTGQQYSELMANQSFEMVAASHVIEHTPDVIGFLENVAGVLANDGRLHLMIPDYRYCFDWARQPSTLAQIIAAHAEKRTKPSPENILDFFAIVHTGGVKNNPHEHWARSAAQRAALAPHVPDSDYGQIQQMQKSLNGGYVDVHVWRFMPSLFTEYMQWLPKNGYLTDLELVSIVPTQPDTFEFFATFRKK